MCVLESDQLRLERTVLLLNGRDTRFDACGLQVLARFADVVDDGTQSVAGLGGGL